MADFTVRVELHKAVGADYDSLHSAMESVGFSRLITGASGKTYHMPWAEYTGSGTLTCERVRDIARDAANTTGKANAVFVTEAQSRAWIGLSSK